MYSELASPLPGCLNPCQKLVKDDLMGVLKCPDGRRSTSRPDMAHGALLHCLQFSPILVVEPPNSGLGISESRANPNSFQVLLCVVFYEKHLWLLDYILPFIRSVRVAVNWVVSYFESHQKGSSRLPAFKVQPVREPLFLMV